MPQGQEAAACHAAALELQPGGGAGFALTCNRASCKQVGMEMLCRHLEALDDPPDTALLNNAQASGAPLRLCACLPLRLPAAAAGTSACRWR
jgi:hypothetical protein